jgi:hypothetical protein
VSRAGRRKVRGRRAGQKRDGQPDAAPGAAGAGASFVDPYRQVFDELAAVALYGDDARVLLQRVAEELGE